MLVDAVNCENAFHRRKGDVFVADMEAQQKPLLICTHLELDTL